MNLVNIDSSEIIFYLKNGNNLSISLTQTQLAVICKILGFDFYGEEDLTCFSDKDLKKIVSMKGNPFNLVKNS